MQKKKIYIYIYNQKLREKEREINFFCEEKLCI